MTNTQDIRIRDVLKRYGPVTALERVNLDVNAREFVTLLGPSGSGKTTLLMILAGFVTPDAGQVLINGVDIVGTPPYRRNLGFVFQNYALFPHMTVFENVAYALRARRMQSSRIRSAVRDALDIVRLQGLEGRRPGELSGGQQQRVALARALVYRPQLLLMDEPLSALDKNLRTHMQLELKQIQQQLGLTVFYVTHDQEEALTMSHRIAVMDGGRIMQVGTPAEVYDAPANRFIAEFVGETNLFKARMTSPDAAQVVLEGMPGTVFGARTPCPSSSPACQDIHLAVRPERIVFCNGHDSGRSGLAAVVSDVVYLGGATKYFVRPLAAQVTDSGLVCVKVSNRSDRRRFEPGDEVRIGWDAMDANIVR